MRIARWLTTKIIKYNGKRIVCFCLIGALVLTALGVCIFFHRHYIEIPVLEYKSMRPTKNHVIVHASCPKDWVWIDTGNGEKILNSFTQNAMKMEPMMKNTIWVFLKYFSMTVVCMRN